MWLEENMVEPEKNDDVEYGSGERGEEAYWISSNYPLIVAPTTERSYRAEQHPPPYNTHRARVTLGYQERVALYLDRKIPSQAWRLNCGKPLRHTSSLKAY